MVVLIVKSNLEAWGTKKQLITHNPVKILNKIQNKNYSLPSPNLQFHWNLMGCHGEDCQHLAGPQGPLLKAPGPWFPHKQLIPVFYCVFHCLSFTSSSHCVFFWRLLMLIAIHSSCHLILSANRDVKLGLRVCVCGGECKCRWGVFVCCFFI